MKKWEHFSLDELKEMCKDSLSINELSFKIGYTRNSGSAHHTVKEMIHQLNLDTSHFLGQGATKSKIPPNFKERKYTYAETFCENSQVSRGLVKKYILQDNLLEYKCAYCGIGDYWNNKTLVLQLDHIDGVYNNHSLSNLQFLCPNCHSQTNTFAGRNIQKKGRSVCIDCGIETVSGARCRSCAAKERARNVERPDRNHLKKLIREQSFVSIGQQYGVSDNAIRKWCDFYNLPRKKSDIKLFTEEEWHTL